MATRPTENQSQTKEASIDEAAAHFEAFLRSLGLDPTNSEHLEDTPRRVARSRINELFEGLQADPSRHLETTFSEGVSDEFVIVDNIEVSSMCAHHFLPFRGTAHVGYIPDEEVVGLSKLSRVVDGYARRPQVQERLTSQIADAIDEKLDPIATVVFVEAEHECMTLRGVCEHATSTRTCALRGKAKEEHHIKQEFFEMLSLQSES